jgi:hypothetical protein
LYNKTLSISGYGAVPADVLYLCFRGPHCSRKGKEDNGEDIERVEARYEFQTVMVGKDHR